MLNKILRGLLNIGLFALLFTPLLVSSSLFFPFITGKAFFFRLLVEIIFALWLVWLTVSPSARPRRSPLLYALGGFGLVVILATIFGQNPYHSFWSNFERMEGLVTYLHLAAYWLVLVSVFKTAKEWRRFLNLELFVSLLVVFASFSQLIAGGTSRLDASFGNAIYLAVYMLINIFLALYLLVGKNLPRWQRAIYAVLILLQLVVLYYTATRGDILGLAVGLLVAALLVLWRGRESVPKLVKRASVGVLVLLVLVGGLVYFGRQSDFVQHSPVLARFASISTADSTTEARLLIWQMSLRGAAEHPLLGWGPENYNLVFNKYYDPRLWHQEQWFDRSHNIFLDWLISAGALGLAGYLSLFVLAFYLLWRRPRAGENHTFTLLERSVLTGLLVGYFFQNIFVFDNLMSYILFLTVLGYLHFAATPAETLAAKPSRLPSALPFAVGFVALILAAAVVYEGEWKPLQAAQTLVRAISPYPAAQKINYFKQVFALNTFGSAEASEQAVSTAISLEGDKSASDADRQTMFNLAFAEMNKQITASPANARYYFFLGLLEQDYQPDAALVAFAKAEEFSPSKQTIIEAPIQLLLGQKKYPEALVAAKRAYDLYPAALAPLQIYALVATYAGDTALEQTLLGQLSQLDPGTPLDDRFINAFAAAKQYDNLLKLWQARVASNPASAENHWRLAAVYFASGDEAQAIKEIQTGIQLEPARQSEGDKLIESIRAGLNPLQ